MQYIHSAEKCMHAYYIPYIIFHFYHERTKYRTVVHTYYLVYVSIWQIFGIVIVVKNKKCESKKKRQKSIILKKKKKKHNVYT